MSEEDIESLIEYIKKDLMALEKGINENEEDLKEIFEYIKISNALFTIDLNFFSHLLDKYGFKVNPSEFDYDPYEYIPIRLYLIENIFHSILDENYCNQRIYIFNNMLGLPVPDAFILIYKLYYAIFRRYIKNSENISDIFRDLLSQWKYTFTKFKMPIKIITHLPLFIKKGKYKFDNKVELKSVWPFIRLNGDPNAKKLYDNYINSYFPYGEIPYDTIKFEDLSAPRGSYLFFKTELTMIFTDQYYYGKEDIPEFYERIREEFENSLKEFFQIINTLYLFELNFEFEDFTIDFPWWWYDTSNLSKFEKFYKKYSNIFYLEREEIEELIILYSNVSKSQIFLDQNSKIITNRYFQIFNRNNLPDIILDRFIVLELIFTRKIERELIYHLSIHGALFLSSSLDEFIKIRDILKNLYDLRSKIVHGGNMEKKINYLKEKYQFRDEKAITEALKSLINDTLKKVVLLKLEDSNILKKFEDSNFFFEQSEFIKKNNPLMI